MIKYSSTRMITGYSRNLTGIKLHLENARGDAITVTGARPDTAFARDVFPGASFGFLQLSQSGILPGSESVVLEVRDRRNPERYMDTFRPEYLHRYNYCKCWDPKSH
jgi:hypothetical protein